MWQLFVLWRREDTAWLIGISARMGPGFDRIVTNYFIITFKEVQTNKLSKGWWSMGTQIGGSRVGQ
jgi:hypothetical protein